MKRIAITQVSITLQGPRTLREDLARRIAMFAKNEAARWDLRAEIASEEDEVDDANVASSTTRRDTDGA